MRKLINLYIILFCIYGQNLLIAKEIKYEVANIPKELRENARSVVRSEEIVFEISSIRSAVKRVTYAITILNKNGIEDSYFRQFYDKFSKVSDIKAKVYDVKGEMIKRIPADQIIDYSAINGFTTYDDNRVKLIDPKVLTLPFTVEYSYEISYNGLVAYPEWDPTEYNKSIEKSSFKILISKDLKLRYLEKNIPAKAMISSDGKNDIYYWELLNFKALLHEPYSFNINDYYPIVYAAPSDFELEGYPGNFTSWLNFGNWIYALNENKNNLSEETKKHLQNLTLKADNDFDKAKIIYEYLQNKTRFVSIQIGIGSLQPFDADKVDRLSYGDCKALSNYLKSMLEAVGIKSYFTLVKSGNFSPDIMKDFPQMAFNHMFICVPIKKDTIWLECTNQRVPFGYLGTFTDDRDVLLVDKNNSKIIHTKAYSAEDNMEIRTSKVKLDNTGGSSKVFAYYKGINYDRMLQILISDDADKKRLVTEKISLPDFQLENFSFKENKEIIPSIEETLNISFANYGTIMGSRMFVPLNFMNRFNNIPERVRSRKTDVYIRRPFSEVDTVTYELPFLYKIESIPQPVKIQSQFGIYEAKAEMKADKLVYIRTLQIKKGKFPPSTYADLIDFFEKIAAADNLKYSLIKKDL